jgi:hypothetical protein
MVDEVEVAPWLLMRHGRRVFGLSVAHVQTSFSRFEAT